MAAESFQQVAPVGQPGQLIGFAEHAQAVLQIVPRGDVAGHPQHSRLAQHQKIQRLHAPLEPDRLLRPLAGQALDVMAAEAVLDHVQPPQRQRVPDFLQEPVGFVGLQHIGEALAHQPLAIVVVTRVGTTEDGGIKAAVRQHKNRVGQRCKQRRHLRKREAWHIHPWSALLRAG